MRLIWATRGRAWGFRFLRTGGLADPYPVYEEMFSALEGLPEGIVREEGRTAVRFIDPLHRADRSGRVISHDFVLLGDLARPVRSVDDGVQEIWPLVSEEFARVWQLEKAPKPTA
ncbi:hypothetical protein [Microbacterium sp. 22242]|uniref:hypothetical protein n=1 Tax=Microbacterium sp. 22242 TaxID=3453896 RepID=UPI003F858AE8